MPKRPSDISDHVIRTQAIQGTYCVLDLDKRIVHHHHFGVVMRKRVAEYNPTDTAKAIDTNFRGHFVFG